MSYAPLTFPLTHSAFPLGVAIASFTDVRTRTAELPSLLRLALQEFFQHQIGTAEVSTLMDTTTRFSASWYETVIVGFLPLLRHPVLKLDNNYMTNDSRSSASQVEGFCCHYFNICIYAMYMCVYIVCIMLKFFIIFNTYLFCSSRES